MDNQKKIPNILINETSPYLLQHAHNPVDWYPWGDEAFEKAKTEDKPVFLSIGYSTCHWCHVMAHESFEDIDVAEILNAGFVSVKVDREERPDIDEVYMSACQAMTGSGGWPLTIIMTADKKPFFAGTYLPKDTMYGRIGLTELLARVVALWQKDRGSLIEQGERSANYFQTAGTKPLASMADSGQIISGTFHFLKQAYDSEYGGFSSAPKFPTPHYLLFLLKYWRYYGDNFALEMAEKTFKEMHRGGIFDHVGYGFSRYSTDERWLVPHFEKMLYDNAMLLMAYTECLSATGTTQYRGVAEKICGYLTRDLQAPDGGFYSAEDADSEGVEGKFYVWDYSELESALTEDELHVLESRYGVTKRGNFEGKNILYLKNADMEAGEDEEPVLKKLYGMREKRVRPFRDEKISASWNGLVIEALARAGAFMNNQDYISAAERAAGFILTKMIVKDNTLCGIYKDGRCTKAFLADYANFANGLMTLYAATRKTDYLKKAFFLADEMVRLFWDEAEDTFYMIKKGDEQLFIRPRDDYDGAMPSGNASAIMCLVRLYNLTGSQMIKETLDSTVKAFLHKAAGAPGAHVHFVSALLAYTAPHRQVVITADANNKEAAGAYDAVLRRFLPFTTAIYYDKSEEMDSLFPELVQYKTDQPFAAYVCENFSCRPPVYSSSDLLQVLGLQS